ncbi:trypsin-like serine peptidase [Microbispora rosea]|uniref:trypsin-like serine peptidase n=1 Tax=Microbispora rosea TaxID=58117 RepID=UPI0034428E2A
MIPRARRLAVPLTGALLATGVAGAIPTASWAATGAATATAAAQAAPNDVTVEAAPQTPDKAAAFWSLQRLRAATDYTEELGDSVRGFGRAGAATADGKAGTVPPMGAGTSGAGGSGTIGKQVNLPRTVGRVFFTLPGRNPLDPKSWKYCSGTSVQGRYRNVVATAGHCVYDPATDQFYDNWVFVPSYWDGDQTWEGKAPYGIYPA